MEDQLRGRGAGGAFADLVAEAEGLGDGEEREDGEEGGAFFEGLGEDASTAAGDDAVDAAEDFGWEGVSVFFALLCLFECDEDDNVGEVEVAGGGRDIYT